MESGNTTHMRVLEKTRYNLKLLAALHDEPMIHVLDKLVKKALEEEKEAPLLRRVRENKASDYQQPSN